MHVGLFSFFFFLHLLFSYNAKCVLHMLLSLSFFFCTFRHLFIYNSFRAWDAFLEFCVVYLREASGVKFCALGIGDGALLYRWTGG